MRSKMIAHERQQKKIAYSSDRVKDLLNDALDAIHFWQSEHDLLARQILLIEKENEILRRKLKIIDSVPSGVVRLPFGGIVK